jgi:predicted lipoprotein
MKAVKYIITVGVIILVAYHSVYFKKLDEVKAVLSAKEFNAPAYAQKYWSDKLIPNLGKAIEITRLSTLLLSDPTKTFDNYSHALGIGNLRYFLVRGRGQIESVNEDDVTVLMEGDSSKRTIIIATEYIFGNAVRDATGAININEFENTMDFNNVSAEINKIIRERVLPPFKKQAHKGILIEFTGAIELNKEHLDLQNIEVLPVEIKLMNER